VSTDSALHVDLREDSGDVAVATVTGSLDLHTAPLFHDRGTESLEQGPFLIVDLGGVTFCDSSGLNALLRLHRQAQAAEGRLSLAAVPAPLARMLEMTGTDALLHVHATVFEARTAHPA
jgi:anti-sigma B factor antagonist